jgi:hypothetical protein
MTIRERVFTHPSQLKMLSVLPFLRTGGMGKLRLGGSIAEHSDIKRWEKELNQYFYACGCDESAKSLIIGLFTGSMWGGYNYFQGTWGWGATIIAPISIAVGGAIIGKFFGLFIANEKLKNTIGEIQEQWQPEDKQDVESWNCG